MAFSEREAVGGGGVDLLFPNIGEDGNMGDMTLSFSVGRARDDSEELVDMENVCDNAGVEKMPEEDRSVSMSACPSSSEEQAEGLEGRSASDTL